MSCVARRAARLLLTVGMAASGLACFAVESRDSVELREVEVVATSTRTTRIGESGALTMDASLLGRTLRSLGEADAVGYLKLLPGVSGGSDYGSGLSVQGGDYSHTLFRINGMPLFFPYHFGGIFSVVSPMHFPLVKFEKAIHDRSAPSRLGGIVDMSTRRGKLESVRGSVNIGVISSGVSVGLPLSNTVDLTVTARTSYIDRLYGKLLKGKSSAIYYNLSDVCVTAAWTPGESDRVTADFFINSDNLKVTDDAYALGTVMKWGNVAGSVGWCHLLAHGEITNTAYYSGFNNSLTMEMPQLGIRMPSEISQLSVNGRLDLSLDHNWRLKTGYALMLNRVIPQWADVNGYSRENAAQVKEHSREAALFAEIYRQVVPSLTLSAGVRVTGYEQGSYGTVLADPSVTASLSRPWGDLMMQVASYSQTLHQVGFSEIGMSSNFWIGSDGSLPVQRALSAAVNYNRSFLDGRYTMSVDLYYKRLRGCSEYDGIILGLLDGNYQSRDNILSGKGYNYGADIMVSKNLGKLTGSAGYAYGIARRMFDDKTGWVTASSELRHSVNLWIRYNLSAHWSLSSVFTYTTGRPVTPIKAFYMVGENVFMDYGRRNSGNLPAYHRLDLSATYSWTTRKWLSLRHFINLSLLNAYGHRNVDIVGFNYDSDDNLFYRKEVTSLYRFMPSVSYSVEF